MKRLVAAGTTVVAVVSLGVWLHHVGSRPDGHWHKRQEAELASVSALRSVDAGAVRGDLEALEAADQDQLVVFKAIIRAEQEAWAEAVARVPVQDTRGLPTAPRVGLDKGSLKRARVADARFGAMLDEIARANGLTREGTDEIHRRGRAEGWKTTP